MNNKIITFSYDGGSIQDKRLIELFNRYNLKGSFNLNYAKLGERGTIVKNNKSVCFDKVKSKDVFRTYSGHEVCGSTLHSSTLVNLGKNDIIYEVETDRLNLSDLTGYEVCGFAYPGQASNYDSRVAEIIREYTHIKYARTKSCSFDFDMPNDLFKIKPTVSHLDFTRMVTLAKSFIEEVTDEKRIFCIYGSSYELDAYNMWDVFEEFLKYISNRDDIDYLTNKEAFYIGD